VRVSQGHFTAGWELVAEVEIESTPSLPRSGF
jgi:hypothetical protein